MSTPACAATGLGPPLPARVAWPSAQPPRWAAAPKAWGVWVGLDGQKSSQLWDTPCAPCRPCQCPSPASCLPSLRSPAGSSRPPPLTSPHAHPQPLLSTPLPSPRLPSPQLSLSHPSHPSPAPPTHPHGPAVNVNVQCCSENSLIRHLLGGRGESFSSTLVEQANGGGSNALSSTYNAF